MFRLTLIGSRRNDALCLTSVRICFQDSTTRSTMSQRDLPDVALGHSWEALPYLDKIWSLPRLPWEARTRLLEMHRAGVLEEGDLVPSTLRRLNSSRLGCEAAEKVLSRFLSFASATRRHTTGPTAGTAQQGEVQRLLSGWKNTALLILLQGTQVRAVVACCDAAALHPRAHLVEGPRDPGG
jgi:hypothetical protein